MKVLLLPYLASSLPPSPYHFLHPPDALGSAISGCVSGPHVPISIHVHVRDHVPLAALSGRVDRSTSTLTLILTLTLVLTSDPI
jgi:hypothetical protein